MLSCVSLWLGGCFIFGLFLLIERLFFRRRPISLLVFPLYISKWIPLFLLVAFMLIPLLVEYLLHALFHNIDNNIDTTLCLAFLGELALFTFLCVYLKRNKILTYGLDHHPHHIRQVIYEIFTNYCQCLPIVSLVTLLWGLLLHFLHTAGFPFSLQSQPIIQLLSKTPPHFLGLLAISLCVIVLAPICEEFFFRGILLRFLRSFTTIKKSLWISAFIFALAHQHFASLAPLLFLGYWLGLCYAKTGHIWVSIGIHSLFNGTNLCLILAAQ